MLERHADGSEGCAACGAWVTTATLQVTDGVRGESSGEEKRREDKRERENYVVEATAVFAPKITL